MACLQHGSNRGEGGQAGVHRLLAKVQVEVRVVQVEGRHVRLGEATVGKWQGVGVVSSESRPLVASS